MVKFFESENIKKFQPIILGAVSLVVIGAIIFFGQSPIFQSEAPCTDDFLEEAGGADKIPLDKSLASGAKTLCAENVLEESETMKKSKSDFWWLNSGGLLDVKGNSISTIQGKLEKNSKWQKRYAKSNSRDTDKGYRPQNIFRLVTKEKWQNLSQSVYFKINRLNLSDSDFRNESNGVLLFNRYQDGDNLYYTGLRVDGDVVIKKKIKGEYLTLDEKEIFSGTQEYDREKNPNSLPLNQWIGIKSEAVNTSSGSVEITLWVDKKGEGNWEKVLEFSDREEDKGQKPILESGHAGIRSDFMDVEFRDYQISSK